MHTPSTTLAVLKQAYQQAVDSHAATAKTTSAGSFPRVLFICSPSDQRHAQVIKSWCIEQRVLATFRFEATSAVRDINSLLAQARQSPQPYTFCAINNPAVFGLLDEGRLARKGSLRDWRGSVLTRDVSGIIVPTLIFLPLLDAKRRPAIHTDPTFRWLLHSDLSKIRTYKQQYRYNYTIIPNDPSAYDVALRHAHAAAITVGDIETSLDNGITINGFTHIGGDLSIGHTFVADLRSGSDLPYKYTKQVYAETQAIKCFHNGVFDTFHLFRHWIPVYNWLFDTEGMWHSLEAELPKSLAFLSSIVLPDYIYWKTEAEENLLEYNAKDCINTARCLVWLLTNMPDWAWKVYGQMLPTYWPTVFCNLEGFATDGDKLAAAREKQSAIATEALAELRTLLGQPYLSANSPKQLETVLYAHLGKVFNWNRPVTAGNRKRATKTGKLPSCTDVTTLRIVQQAHPLAARIIDALLRYRAANKAMSTYFDTPLYGESKRLLYSFAPDGTKTGRFSCSASSLRLVTGCSPTTGAIRKSDITNFGNQIQNAPPYYKAALRADDGYLLFNIDKSKSEAHCVALVSGDQNFKAALEDTALDFYLRLAEWFFGVETNGDKELPIRQVTKKINHASSYCMAWETFFDQIGARKMHYFMDLVGWQGPREAKPFISYLLGLYHSSFPLIQKNLWYGTTRKLIENNGYLESPDGAIRRFHKIPSHAKAIVPAAVAHIPQRLSVMGLNRAMVQVFYEIQLPTKFALRLKGQVHDSLVGQVLVDRTDLIAKAHEIMERPYETSMGTLRIPCDLTGPSTHWKE